ncbi:MAG TPA: glycosyltransferase family 2 protein [Acidimicrobiia bacterium]|nr:glycosyltransferase family 2 protein [Acidimicrobiia bacterium]
MAVDGRTIDAGWGGDRAISYVLPLLRRPEDSGLEELSQYLRWLAEHAEIIVVDGSDPSLFSVHHALWKDHVVHVAPHARPCLNGKVEGVLTGVYLARHERVVIADDDVRYDLATLNRVATALVDAQIARPQNYFDPLPWHAAWDTARTLLNRCFGSDSPGTYGVRRSFLLGIGGYDGDVLFENRELERTVEAAGGIMADLAHVFVRRIPPTWRRFWEQRPRQAYDDFAHPVRLVGFLTGIPAGLFLASRGRGMLGVAALAATLMAEVGRRRSGGRAVFPVRSVLFAPAWVAERCIFSWVAVMYRVVGGIPYSGARFKHAAHSVSELKDRLREQTAGDSQPTPPLTAPKVAP